jgi:hypothetical protein
MSMFWYVIELDITGQRGVWMSTAFPTIEAALEEADRMRMSAPANTQLFMQADAQGPDMDALVASFKAASEQ